MPRSVFPVGFLVATGQGYAAICGECATKTRADLTPIYHVNVYPHNQTCGACGRSLVVGRTPEVPNLFSATVPKESK